MMTLLQSATNGWLDYTQHGKYAALLLAAILYLGYCLWKSQSSKERWEAAAVLFICGADHAGLHLPGDSGNPDEIPDRLLLLCMDLGGGAPDSTDRLGMQRTFLYTLWRKKKYPECGWLHCSWLGM